LLSNVYDDNWQSYAMVIDESSQNNLEIVYEKPIHSTSNSIWKVKIGDNIKEFATPQRCWDYSETELVLLISVMKNYQNYNGIYLACNRVYNGMSGFYPITGIFTNELKVYEEAMIWTIDECGEPTCSDGNKKCIAELGYICENGDWVVGGDLECAVDDECSIGEEKCEGQASFICSNKEWTYDGLIDGKCGYVEEECINGDEQCEGQYNFICEDNDWTIEGLVDGKCGYESPDCTAGNKKCIAELSYICENGIWVVGGDLECAEGFDWDKVLFKIGEFEVTLIILLLGIGGLILVLYILNRK